MYRLSADSAGSIYYNNRIYLVWQQKAGLTTVPYSKKCLVISLVHWVFLRPLVCFVFSFSMNSLSISILKRDNSLKILNNSSFSCLFLLSSRVHNTKYLNLSSYDLPSIFLSSLCKSMLHLFQQLFIFDSYYWQCAVFLCCRMNSKYLNSSTCLSTAPWLRRGLLDCPKMWYRVNHDTGGNVQDHKSKVHLTA